VGQFQFLRRERLSKRCQTRKTAIVMTITIRLLGLNNILHSLGPAEPTSAKINNNNKSRTGHPNVPLALFSLS
jgi:hypothetical protein